MNLLEAKDSADIKTIRVEHRNESHNGDQLGWYDCAACGAIDNRLDRFERKEMAGKIIQEFDIEDICEALDPAKERLQ